MGQYPVPSAQYPVAGAHASNARIWWESKPQQYASLGYGQMLLTRGTRTVTLNTIVILTKRDRASRGST